jgi:proline iminopeptidase
MCAQRYDPAHERFLPADGAALYYREIGTGQPIIILHGGPDFDFSYMLPAMDRFATSFRLIYYAQRGRGKSSGQVRPDEVSIDSETADLERVRQHFGLDTVAVLGHSWGGVLAMEYAIRHPERVSHLILLNSGPASQDDFLLFRAARAARTPEVLAQLNLLRSAPGYIEGDLEAEAAYYRVHFAPTIRNAEQLERLVQSLRVNFRKDDIIKARLIEDRLMQETWLRPDYNLLPGLRRLSSPSLVVHSDHDFIPVECAAHIAEALSGARFVLLNNCGHFSYEECADKIETALVDLLR